MPGANPTENGLLEGISSLHSWIKSQTMIRPHGREETLATGIIRTFHDDEVGSENEFATNVYINHIFQHIFIIQR